MQSGGRITQSAVPHIFMIPRRFVRAAKDASKFKWKETSSIRSRQRRVSRCGAFEYLVEPLKPINNFEVRSARRPVKPHSANMGLDIGRFTIRAAPGVTLPHRDDVYDAHGDDDIRRLVLMKMI